MSEQEIVVGRNHSPTDQGEDEESQNPPFGSRDEVFLGEYGLERIGNEDRTPPYE